jgi:uncharacterized protein
MSLSWMVLVLPVFGLAATNDDVSLVEAAKNQDQATIRALLTKHVDVNKSSPDGATALAWAAHWDDADTADLLLRAGANVNAVNEYGVGPLSLACTNGSAAMVAKLVNAGANPNIALPSGETALMTCARAGSVEAVRTLVTHGADVNAKENEKGQTALMWAVAEKHASAAVVLIGRGADVNARSKSGFTPLLFAARQGDLESAQILLAAGANVNETSPGGMSALVVASASGHEELALFLIEKGSNPNLADGSGVTALHYAVRKGFQIPGVEFGEKPLVHYAYRPNMLGLVKALLAHGANPNARIASRQPLLLSRGINVVGATPFMLAAADADVSVMRALLAGGADPLLATKQGTTPMMAAAGMGRPKFAMQEDEEKDALEAVRLTVELGGDVNATNENGQTAVHAAAYVGAANIIQFLADKGAKLDVKDKVVGQTPLTIAAGVLKTGTSGVVAAYALSTKEGLTVSKPMGARTTAVNLLRKLLGGDTTQFTCPAYIADPYNNVQPMEFGEIHCPPGR